MQTYSRDELIEFARPTRDHLLKRTEKQVARTMTETEATALVLKVIPPTVPIHLCYTPGPYAEIVLHLSPLPLLNVLDMMQALPPISLLEFKDGTTRPSSNLPDAERSKTYRDVAAFFIRAQFDIFGHPVKKTDAKIGWWTRFYDNGDLPVVAVSMGLFDSDDYLVCDYRMESPRSKKVRTNGCRTKFAAPQVTRYGGADRNSPFHWYIHWDMNTTIENVIETLKEEFDDCYPIN